MSLEFIHNFQINLYNLLSQNKIIRSKIDKIYLSVVQDGKYPFVLINILELKNTGNNNQEIHNVLFEISIFYKDKSQNALIQIANHIKNILNTEAHNIADYIVTGIRLTSTKFERGHDLVTKKVVMQYQALIKNKIIS